MREKQKSRRMLLTALIVLAFPLVLAGIISAVVLQLTVNGRMTVFVGTMSLMFVFAVILVVAVFMIRQLLNRIRILVGNLGQIADGTLSMKEDELAEREDGIGQMMQSVNGMVTSFAKIITSVKNAADSLVKISGDFTQPFQEMESSMQQIRGEVSAIGSNTVSQLEITQEIGTQIMDMSHMVDAMVQNVDILTKGADKMKECSKAAKDIMGEMASINEDSSKAIADAQAQADVMNQSAIQIRGVMGIIKGISNQANLLALNASIEAARAGEMGKGFETVAEEIRALADQSREFSQQMNAVTNELIENSNISVDIIRKVSETFGRQTEKISQTEGIFVSLNQEIEQVGRTIDGMGGEAKNLKESKEVIDGGIMGFAEDAEADSVSVRETLQAMDIVAD